MSKMTVIQLLNKIANEEVIGENKIKIDNNVITIDTLLVSYIFNKKRLNEEVEIIEEDKKIEKIGANNYKWNYKYDSKTPQAVVDNLELVRQKINEIIDYLEDKE